MTQQQNTLFDINLHDSLSPVSCVSVMEDKKSECSLSKRKIGASPFVKWAGGKRSIMNSLLLRLPESFTNYYEPFVGGGALFFELAKQGKLEKKQVFLSDTNLDLVFAYNAIKKSPKALIEELKEHKRKHNTTYFYKVRKRHNLKDPIEIAARFLYMNKTCFNGLWRVNNKGEFNVPVGKYKNPDIVQEDKIAACHQVLQGVNIQYLSFHEIQPKPGDFVYFDPPYHPKDNSSFTRYSKFDFTEQDQIRLRNFTLSLHEQGVHVMLSNSETQFIKTLYDRKGFTIDIVQAPRFVNCKANGRNAVGETLITNYTNG
ncbi:DNA adenine methylase [Roseofilum casamattae]|uniref:Site-specific DNA-methyltransferase (adenine-specific) n=1 Tax=Roseofilum casamattae BLCC-M143 TaxID=3022442 RepID=A0ABT7C3G9_9CYAN|nr:DNA adenine methylase [Roseofilum casamattae]MDJ1185647.1 DNA adenine methylase [Roseofilum casamattae BLCC-M143]